ncbi:sugar transferase [Chroococcidiopsis sp. FACHB-1243]|uniref:heterocyst development glycosyltransferase HepC n=1 Tax=Chroococcidiopsis sp. [FACHB-1243] TaxID=2692781 RepID=UPI00177FF3ED|nr:heterocyst development glycosyltransferase HepC [Chroococcidiopsis sp. [FACHB-1243]]MBD2306396.1 sugar transferase [Chroococcidiopsis sp. [FACHB-1243]]
MQNSEFNLDVRVLDSYSSPSLLKHGQIESISPNYEVKLRQGQLLVKLASSQDRSSLLSSRDRQFLTEWLQYCPARLVRIDPALGAIAIQLWADVCKQTEKVTFLRIPPAQGLRKHQYRFNWWVKRIVERIIAIVLLVTLSPVFLGLSLLIYFDSPGRIFSYQWCVGERGKLFQMIKFRTTAPNLTTQHHQTTDDRQDPDKCNDLHVTRLGCWMRKYSLNKLPQLLNVVRGDMSFVGSSAYGLNDAIRLAPDSQRQLNALPGIIALSHLNFSLWTKNKE